jgi:hypothetical protein
MSVTDNNSAAGVLVNSRNMPYGDRPPSRALYRAEVCGRCFGEIAPDEPVWMRAWCSYWNEYSGAYTRFSVFAAACADCSGVEFRWRKVADGMWADGDFYPEYWYEGACQTCGRTVFKERRYMRRHFFCGRSCEEAYWSRRRRRPKLETVCKVCGAEFTATRSDAKTCSPACKQKAYRRRRAAT